MRNIVAGQQIVTEVEMVEAAFGFSLDLDPEPEAGGFVPGPQDLADLAAFVEDVTDPSGSGLDAENALAYRMLTRNIVSLSRRRIAYPKAVAA